MAEPPIGHIKEFYENLDKLFNASVREKNVGITYLGDFTTYQGIELQWFGTEFGLLFIVQIIGFVILMNRLNGRFTRMVQWIHSLDFEIFGNTIKSNAFVIYYSIVGYSYLVWPLICLTLWAAVVIKDGTTRGQILNIDNSKLMAGISIFLLGFCFITIINVALKITWNNYRFKALHLIISLSVYFAFTAWQFSIMFSSIRGAFSFMGISAVFLTQSGIFYSVMVYLNLYENKFNLIYFLNKFVKNKGEPLDPKRTNDILQEVQKEKTDDDWLPTLNSIFDFITIGKISEEKMMNAFGRGFQRMAMDRSIAIRYVVNACLLGVHAGCLAVYSYLVFYYDNNSKLGIIVSLAVFVNDMYFYLMFNARIITKISLLTLMIFCSRLFIFMGGKDYWVYGYLAMYIWTECMIALNIVRKRLPFNTEVDVNSTSDLPFSIKKVNFVDLARMPEFLFILITLSVVVTVIVVTLYDYDGVGLADMPIGVDGITVQYALAGSVLIVISFLFVWCWLRAFKRKIDVTMGYTFVYLCDKKIDQYYIFCMILYLIVTFWVLVVYPFVDDPNLLVSGFFIPAILFFFLNIVITYIKNGYFFVEDIEGLNREIRYHNQRVDTLKMKARELRQILLEKGPDAVYGEENGSLVQKVMDREVASRAMQKEMMKIQMDENRVQAQENAEEEQFRSQKTGMFGRRITKDKNKAIEIKKTMTLKEAFEARQKAKTSGSTLQNNNKVGPINAVAAIPDQLVDISDASQLELQPASLLLQQSSSTTPPPVTETFGRMNKMGATMQGFKLDENESSEEDIEAIPAHLRPYRHTRIDKKKKRIRTWQDERIGFCTAFFTNKLRSNDYVVLWSLIFMVALIFIYGGVSFSVTEKGLGIIFAIDVLHVILLAISMLGNIIANRHAEVWEYLLCAGSFVIIQIASFVYAFVRWDRRLYHTKKEQLSPEDLLQRDAAVEFVIIQIIIIPFITAFITFCGKAYRDNKNGNAMSAGFWLLLVLIFLHASGLIVILFEYLDRNAAWACIVGIVYCFYGFIQYIVRVRYSNRALKIGSKEISVYVQSRIWNSINFIFALAFIGGGAAFAFTRNNFSTFAAVSIVVACLVLMLFTATLALFVKDRTKMDEQPIYHSPWIFPIYKYYPKENDIASYNSSVVLFYFLAFLCLCWSIWTAVEVSPSWLGVGFTCVVEAVTIIVSLYFVNTNNEQYNKVKEHVDALVIKQAWLDAKENLCRMLQINNRAQYVSYETWWRRRYDLRNYMLIWQGKSIYLLPETEEFNDEFKQHVQDLKDSNEKGNYIRSKIEEWADPDEVNLDSWEDCQKFMYQTDKDVRHAYMAELETVVQFQLIILQNAMALQEIEKQYLFKFIRDKRAHLYLVGISFEIPVNENANVRYALTLNEIRKLTPDKQTLFNALKDKFIEEERQKLIDEQMAEEKEAEKAKARLEEFGQMNQARRAAIENLKKNPNMPIDQMPDCDIKLQRIREQCALTGTKFTDVQWHHEKEEQVLGKTIFDAKSQRAITGWKRASEIPGAKLFIDGASHEDITQGALGDCYFLSALSVLGNERTVRLFKCQEDNDHQDETDPNNWKKTGCFMLQFHQDGDFTYVIVDDYIPMAGDQPAFTKGGENGLEMWPAIIEKAYAKMYGSYTAIEAGKVHLALADLVENGFPEQLALKDYKNNVKLLTSRLAHLDKIRALMGAGSPEHEMGDKAVNEDGIVQGHAYAILDVDEYLGTQLVKLRNPHGKASYTREWTGDWADESPLWTMKARATLNYYPSQQVDGIFWMSNVDFINNFKYIYLCRELSAKEGWFTKEIQSKWEGPSSAGFPGKLRSVPQFKLTLSRPTPGYISLTQKGSSSGSSFKGKNFTGWMVSCEQGKLLTKIQKPNIIMKAGISDLKTLSSEVDFDSKVDYPYSFTIVCGSQNAGPEGEGDFELKVYTRDTTMKLEKLNYAKD